MLSALGVAGRDPHVRAALLTALRDAQAASADPAKFCEAVRWPLVEHLLRDVPELEVTLASGARIGISPRASRIEKHLLLAAEEAPHHVWEPQTTSLLGLLARDTADVIVGGAYIGDQVVPLADELRRRAAAAVIHAFEPAPWAFGHLVRNVERNGFDNVRCHRIGLWSEPAAGMRLVGEPALGAVTSQASSDGDVVEVTTIDAHCAAHGIAEVGLVMLDLEGGEEAALLGASSLLARPAGQAPAVVFEVHREHVDWSDGLDRTPIVTGLLALGYTVVAVRDLHGNRDMLGRPIEVVPVDDVYLGGPPHGFNVLAVKDAALLDRPELEVVPGVSPKLLPHGDPALHHPRGGF